MLVQETNKENKNDTSRKLCVTVWYQKMLGRTTVTVFNYVSCGMNTYQ